MNRKGYQHALMVTNLLPENDESIIEEAEALRGAWKDIKLSLVQVITRVPVYCLQLPSLVDIQDRLYCEAKDKLKSLGNLLDIPTTDQWLLEGSVEKEVIRLAKHIRVDLIITGDHDEDSLPALLGGSLMNRLFHHSSSSVDLLCMHGH